MKIKLMFGDCLERIKEIPDNSIDLVVTSPPYDKLRTYKDSLNWDFEIFQKVANELKRTLKKGGVIVWVVGDATVKGSETGSSFKQALYFKEIGLNIHDTMIYSRGFSKFPRSNGYGNCFEYMFVFSKGKPKTFNPLKEKSNRAGRFSKISDRQISGETRKKKVLINPEKTKSNLWIIDAGYMRSSKDKIAFKHPAIFPEKLAHDHIISWSNEGDTVLDPFMGSGTTAKQAKLLKRNFIGIECVKEYFRIAKQRIKNA